LPVIKTVPVTVDMKGFTFDLSPQAEIATNYAALDDAIARNPGLYARWAVLEAQARKVYDALVTKMEVLEAVLFEKYRAAIQTPVDAIKACVKSDTERVELATEINEAKSNLELLMVGRKTIEQKKDSLLAIASNFRAEMQSGIRVNRNDSMTREAREYAERGRVSRPVPPRRNS